MEEEREKVLILKKKRGHSNVSVKVRSRVRKGFAPDQYVKVLNPLDFNDLALLLQDLDLIIGAPVEKAITVYRNKKGEGFPFF